MIYAKQHKITTNRGISMQYNSNICQFHLKSWRSIVDCQYSMLFKFDNNFAKQNK